MTDTPHEPVCQQCDDTKVGINGLVCQWCPITPHALVLSEQDLEALLNESIDDSVMASFPEIKQTILASHRALQAQVEAYAKKHDEVALQNSNDTARFIVGTKRAIELASAGHSWESAVELLAEERDQLKAQVELLEQWRGTAAHLEKENRALITELNDPMHGLRTNRATIGSQQLTIEQLQRICAQLQAQVAELEDKR